MFGLNSITSKLQLSFVGMICNTCNSIDELCLLNYGAVTVPLTMHLVEYFLFDPMDK